MSRAYRGESADEFYGITCPDDLVQEERYEPEYDPYSDPDWGKHASAETVQLVEQVEQLPVEAITCIAKRIEGIQ